MKYKVSKALEEVWDWKDRVYEEDKSLTIHESIKKSKATSEKVLREMGLIRTEVKHGVYRLKRKSW